MLGYQPHIPLCNVHVHMFTASLRYKMPQETGVLPNLYGKHLQSQSIIAIFMEIKTLDIGQRVKISLLSASELSKDDTYCFGFATNHVRRLVQSITIPGGGVLHQIFSTRKHIEPNQI